MATELEYVSKRPTSSDREGFVYLLILKSLIGYLILSTITIPFLNAFWIGELPVLALVHVPKVELANAIRWQMVMRLLPAIGWSHGSFSPDWIVARPWALALLYLVVVGLVLCVVAWRRGLRGSYGRWTIALIAMAIVDYLMTMFFSNTRGLTIY